MPVLISWENQDCIFSDMPAVQYDLPLRSALLHRSDLYKFFHTSYPIPRMKDH